MRFSVWTAFLAAAGPLRAQFVSHNVETLNLTVVRFPGLDNVTVSYKEPHGVCRTVREDQKQYTGWVNIPGKFPTNIFFWFVEARKPSEDLTVWLNGGPGSSSMLGFWTGNGPCRVIEKGINQFDTMAWPWGWDGASNMLFIDQPNQVGFSYDTPTPGTMSMMNESVLLPPVPPNKSHPPWNLVNGTFSSHIGNHTANTTQIAAMAVWHVVQAFLAVAPTYRARPKDDIAVHLWAESYGGVYGPIFAEVWEAQNRRRATGSLSKKSTVQLRLVSLGIINGCIDRMIETPFYPIFANNNSYGLKALSDKKAAFYQSQFSQPGGCRDNLLRCAEAVAAQDPNGNGMDTVVNKLCSKCDDSCTKIMLPYYDSGLSAYDISRPAADPLPAPFLDYLNHADVQVAVGSPVNYTMGNPSVYFKFVSTGDMGRGGNIDRLAALIKAGVRVSLVFGDLDYICNWYGGEAISLAVAKKLGGRYAEKFPAAGYAPIKVNGSFVGGEVRQFGNLSFCRVYRAGHSVASSQPETAFEIFSRVLGGRSISTGSQIDLSTYNTSGPLNSTHTDKLPDAPQPTCYVRAFESTCGKESQQLADRGGGVVINGILYGDASEWPLAASTSAAAKKLKASATASDSGAASARVDCPIYLYILAAVIGILYNFVSYL